MIGNFGACLAFVLKREGGFTDDPRDPGGATNLGVTRATWQRWTGHAATAQDIAALKVEDVTPLYKKYYWDTVKGDQLPTGLDLCLFDSAVNQGPNTAIMMLQKVLGTHVDAIMGPATMGLITMNSPSTLIQEFCDARRNRYFLTKNYTLYGKGWIRRVDACQDAALSMAASVAASA
jgi:lysozyme family protein